MQRAKFRRTRAFSLVEISLSLGIFAFSILSIMGILTVALDTFRESQRESTLTSLVRVIDADIRSAYDEAAVTALSASNRYYDITGKSVTNAVEIYYTVKLSPVAASNTGTVFMLENPANINLWSARITIPSSNAPPVNVLFGSTRPAL
ncbi:MAG: Verru_Chthon cassette protein B [Candidatus Methylacidiphilales bacterium]|nr:Verru_Chthon cassette protein B [Candidatus Methylacidiphilales bacterium]